MKKKHGISTIVCIIILLSTVVALLIYMYNKIRPQYFDEMIRAEFKIGLSELSRDQDVKYNDKSSFKIESNEFNDAMYYKEVDVIPNTPYKATCMVKTENVSPKDEWTGAGARNMHSRYCREI